MSTSVERRAELEARFTPVTSGNCEAGDITPSFVHRARARYEGPMTVNGGNLWCGACRKQYIEERLTTHA